MGGASGCWDASTGVKSQVGPGAGHGLPPGGSGWLCICGGTATATATARSVATAARGSARVALLPALLLVLLLTLWLLLELPLLLLLLLVVLPCLQMHMPWLPALLLLLLMAHVLGHAAAQMHHAAANHAHGGHSMASMAGSLPLEGSMQRLAMAGNLAEAGSPRSGLRLR